MTFSAASMVATCVTVMKGHTNCALLKSSPGTDARITRERSIVKGKLHCTGRPLLHPPSPPLPVLDTNCVIHQIDFLESAGSSGAFSNVIIPQTVMNEIRGLNVSVYNRMHTLLQVHQHHPHAHRVKPALRMRAWVFMFLLTSTTAKRISLPLLAAAAGTIYFSFLLPHRSRFIALCLQCPSAAMLPSSVSFAGSHITGPVLLLVS
jgi:hypothetical protein